MNGRETLDAPMRADKSERGNRFPLSLRERAGVRGKAVLAIHNGYSLAALAGL